MVSTPTQPTELVIRKAEMIVAELELSHFSEAASDMLQKKIAEHANQLVSESVKLSKRDSSDTVSADQVLSASKYVFPRSSRRFFGHLGTIGGIFSGVALSNIFGMNMDGPFTNVGNLLNYCLGTIGAFLLAIHIKRD